MQVGGTHFRTIWPTADGTVEIIDQTRLPHAFATARLATSGEAVRAIRAMQVRGAPLIGATAAYGLWLALRSDPSDRSLATAYESLLAARPTAVNLCWALDRLRDAVSSLAPADRSEAALREANAIADDDVASAGRSAATALRSCGK